MRDPEILQQVKDCLARISAYAPGHAVELRIPPYSAIQCVEGPKHTRGTPPNVVEMKAEVLFALLEGRGDWQSFISTGEIHASGERADLSALFTHLAETN